MKVTVTEIHEMESTGAGFDMVMVTTEAGSAILSKSNTYDRDLTGCNEYRNENTVEYATWEDFWHAGWNNAYKALYLAPDEARMAAVAALKKEQAEAAAAGKTHFWSTAYSGAHYSRTPNGRKWRLTEIVF